MKTKHTQGEWNAVEYAGFWIIKTENYYDSGYDVLSCEEVGEREAEANAKLIAAAPDLLEALQKIDSYFFDSEGKDQYLSKKQLDILETIKEVIKKATE